MESASVKNGAVSNRGWHLVRIGVAGLLLTTSALKCWQLATEPVIGTSLLDSRWLLMAAVEFELFFGILLLANIWAKPSWAVALACFGLFTCVSVCKALAGHASCGCFGRVPVNPWYTGTLDLAVVLSLLRWRPKESLFTIHRAIAVLMIWVLIGIPVAYAMGSHTDTALSDTGVIVGSDQIVTLKPETWIGKQLPLLDYIDVGNKLKEGEWHILLYHHDCPKCQGAIRAYQKATSDPAWHFGNHQVALIDMPPYDSAATSAVSLGSSCLLGRVSNSKDWLVETPVEITLDQGFVVKLGGKVLDSSLRKDAE